MPPPPVTPSPHRFLPSSSAKSSHPPASTFGTRLPQFRQTPRFSTPASRPATQLDTLPDGARVGLTRVESIEEPSQENADEDEEMLFGSAERGQDHEIIQSVESTHLSAQKHYPNENNQTVSLLHHPVTLDSPSDAERSPKRQRLIPKPDYPESSTIHDVTPTSMPISKPSRFILAPNSPGHGSFTGLETSAMQSTRSRNPFLLPDSTQSNVPPKNRTGATTNTIAPLPEHFSPHRRAEKFAPGGMADVVRGWILNVGQNGPTQHQLVYRNDRPQRGGTPAIFQVTDHKDSVRSEQVNIVAGRALRREENPPSKVVNAMLVGAGKGAGSKLKNGDTVRVGSPSWGIEIGQPIEPWTIGVHWDLV
ncbi:uncharacterized protein K452DRAFT_320449 [Aplosporella prunicola CBS 121167]|uniref:Uncharacterized protein n=1 Tax=Aplosporella prunicola CBS 121167 TaxID=1176127 RepID=A0A6A6B7D4_9PEZI|nr:uncharacterized protein K452DRAFT_320449 [Aplosporella prunicola CBS 121167]KAF2139303.1 hypothetical protein K452DRAFT_320449 [Aplosporella prunicola CBS 121167]